ncbi:DUF167 domain-containing protein [Candidatus Babeliales bacterium]|nr:DUF167 domain-containing protein [Candidatus Babeliales bacterium]
MTLTLKIRVTPNAKKQSWKIDESGTIKCYVTAQAQDGKANQAVIKAFAKLLRIPHSHVEITKGSTSRIKEIAIEDNFSKQDIIDLVKNA